MMYIDNPEKIVNTILHLSEIKTHVISIYDNGPDNAETNRLLLSSLNTNYLLSPAKVCMHFLKNAYFHRLLSGYDPDDEKTNKFIIQCGDLVSP